MHPAGCPSALARTVRSCRSHVPNHALLPFLYQTRTIQANSPALPSRRRAHDRAAHPTAVDSQPPKSDTLLSEDGREDAPRKRDRTITDTERKAFKRLFDSLTGSPQTARRPSLSRDIDASRIEEAATEPLSWLENEDLLDDDPVLDQDADEPVGMSPDAGRSQTARYPAELQSMAERAQMAVKRQSQEAQRKKAGLQAGQDSAAAARQRQTFRAIENSLLRARTDVEIWKILQTELFPRLQKLDRWRSEKDGLSGPAAKKRARKAARSKKTKPAEEDASMPELFVQAYHFLFLLALRLMCRRTTYTPLASALLPAVRAHSLTSSILGTSVAIYNEALAHQWRCNNDVAGMLAMLNDFHGLGLTMNAPTLRILDDVSSWGRQARDGDFGLALQAVESSWVRQGEYDEVDQWRDSIRASLEDKAVAQSHRAQMYRQMRDEGALAEDEPREEQALAGSG